MPKPKIGVLGASSMVGECLLTELSLNGWLVNAFSRKSVKSTKEINWHQLSVNENLPEIPSWICVAPIWVLPKYFQALEASGVQRVVAVSSTSRFTKVDSSDPAEQVLVTKLIQGEERLERWAQSRDIDWVILRPTLIYGLARDKNISEIARFIRRFGFFPLFGKAEGLRQPIHVTDVAKACVSAVNASNLDQNAYNISGGETLTYREMVIRIFEVMGKTPHVLNVPLWLFRVVVAFAHQVPRYRHLSVAMAQRMNQDLIFDQTSALSDLRFKPSAFQLTPNDLLRKS